MLKNLSFLELLFSQRSFVMGLSMIAIMLFHECFVGGWAMAPLHHFGHFGVDVFFFLSGMGIAISLKKSAGVSFYIRRAKRLLPAWIVVAVLSYCIKSDWSALSVRGFAGWFFHWWFLNTLLIFYLLSPVLMRIVSTFGILRTSLSLVMALAVFFYLRYCAEQPWKIDVLPRWRILVDWTLYRLPAYWLGVCFAVFPARCEQFKSYWVGVAVVSFPLSCFLRIASVRYVENAEIRMFADAFSYSVLAFSIPVICYFASAVGRFIEQKKPYRIICLFGILSLELYLWHEWLYGQIRVVMKTYAMNGYVWLCLAVGLSLLLAWSTQLFCSRMMLFLNPSSSPQPR